ncbi:MAG: hypothetical protein Q9184_003229 [Pyrenodesmia sp. 2 TL-2023]
MVWDFRTLQVFLKIAELVASASQDRRICHVSLYDSAAYKDPQATDLGGATAIQAFLCIEARSGRARGLVGLVPSPEDGSWKAFILLTGLEELKGHEERTHTRRPTGHEAEKANMNWKDQSDSLPQVFTPKDKLADWFTHYAGALELNAWMRTEITSSQWDDAPLPKHIILVTGNAGEPHFPSNIPGIDTFRGDRLTHSSNFTEPSKDAKGKKAVIVDDADIINMSIPNPVAKTLQIGATAEMMRRDNELLRGLTAAGFKIDSGPDGASLFMKYLTRGGGYYIDTGTSRLIVDGKIKIVQGHGVKVVQAHSLLLEHGSEIEADEIIFATGYESMRETARKIFGDELAERVNDGWGFDAEGETRGMWRRSGHLGFWFFGGNRTLCRFYFKLLALQIKAIEIGLLKV